MASASPEETKTMRRRTFFSMAGAAAALPSREASALPVPGRAPSDGGRLSARNRDRSSVVARHGMVCTSQPLATLVGIDLLKKGGTCVDAALGANAALGLMEPGSCGIGGDLFALVWWEKDEKLYGLNASGRAPAAWSLAEAQKRGLTRIPRKSPLSWSVPGCVSGWQALSGRFGRLGLRAVLQPAIAYAREGFPLSPIIASEQFTSWSDGEEPHLAAVYHPAGKVPGYGDLFQNPWLASSYERIAQAGAAGFYEGETAERIVAQSKALSGLMTLDDLRSHQADWVEPVSTGYRGYDVWEIPPNGQGICALQILNLMETFDVAPLGHNSVDHLHLFIEAKKLAFEDRARYYADPAFAKVPLPWLVSKDYARERVRLIDRKRAAVEPRPGDPPLDSDTVYLCAADAEGNMISLIQSIYSGFGSGICPEGVGFAMQNRGQAFSLDPGHKNRLEPRKRPFHTIIPAFLTRQGAPVMAFGVMGGDFQTLGHAQVVMNMLDFGLSVQQATDVPRISHDGSSSPWGGVIKDGGEVVPEPGFEPAVLEGLLARGHRVSRTVEAHGGYQAIWREDNPRRYFGGSDPRKDGQAIGF
jgi:gamma-glutamyltranspeptidase/glutathione hydrolase